MRKYFYMVVFIVVTASSVIGQSAPSSITGERNQCVSNRAGQYSCQGIDLFALVSLKELDANAELVNDVWGWTDPDTKRDYALVGTSKSVAFVDVSDPINPIYLGKLNGRNENSITWRDMKVYNDHMFVVVDGPNNGMQVFDLRQLRTARTPQDWKETAFYDQVSSAHNLAINEETGFVYITGYQLSSNGSSDTCRGRGIHMVNIKNPIEPTYAGCIADFQTGGSNDGYTHDAQCLNYRGPDIRYQGREICIGSNETHISIVDVTNKQEPQIISAASYPHVGYTHQGWLTKDQQYFLMNDETDELSPDVNNTRTIIWNLAKLDDPVYHSSFFLHTTSIDHNLYIHGDYMYAANYLSGLRIIDISDIDNPVEVAYFDTYANDSGFGNDGAWSSYRFSGSGTTIVSSHPDGLFILDVIDITITGIEISEEVPEAFTLSNAYPNPFNSNTTFTLSTPQQTMVHIEVIDILGRGVDMIHQGVLNVGRHNFSFDGSQLPSGSYEIRVSSDSYTTGIRVVLVK